MTFYAPARARWHAIGSTGFVICIIITICLGQTHTRITCTLIIRGWFELNGWANSEFSCKEKAEKWADKRREVGGRWGSRSWILWRWHASAILVGRRARSCGSLHPVSSLSLPFSLRFPTQPLLPPPSLPTPTSRARSLSLVAWSCSAAQHFSLGLPVALRSLLCVRASHFIDSTSSPQRFDSKYSKDRKPLRRRQGR